ncbi:hypothetical protein [Sphingomonas abietis]|uniref:Uncharacterized protein n=1 Tax=Sphingomonas abietis TaxID=3012344 RepID=A0ABY7NQH7_9SPHN|nr:hypothetical protein [Sphingomonas abietis]WBO22807.1 hypothetical protein PBT88_01240 [Sphingomonas abietis]
MTMGISAALALLAVASAPPDAPANAPPASTMTAEQAMAHYHAMIDAAAPAPHGASQDCPLGTGTDILVCAHRPDKPQRLPLRDERAEPGEVVRHPAEPPRAAGALNDKPQCQYNCGPSPAKETWGRLFRILKGEDPDD